MATQIADNDNLTESDLLSLLCPNILYDNENIKEKFYHETRGEIEDRKIKILNIIKVNYWSSLIAELSKLQKRRQKLKDMEDGIDFLAYIIKKVDKVIYEYLVDLYILERDLSLLSDRENSSRYVELCYDD